jgi:hypothetical protein
MAEIDRQGVSSGGGGGNVTVINIALNPVIIRPLDCTTDHIDICDRVARLLGEICYAGSAIDPRAIRTLTFLTDSVDVSGSSITATISGTPTVDVSDRAARLLGIIYGSQNQQLLQTPINFNTQVELATGATLYDARQIRNLLFASDAINVSGSNINAVVTGSVTANAGTNLNTSLLALEAGGNLATIAGKDFATQTTLALIKAKTDNLDVLLSTRTKPSDQQHAIVDSGTVIATQATGTNLHTVVDSGNVNANVTNSNINVTVSDIYMALRLLTNYLSDLQMTIDPATMRNRVIVEAGSLTTVANIGVLNSIMNIANIGSRDASLFQNDIMDLLWASMRDIGVI